MKKNKSAEIADRNLRFKNIRVGRNASYINSIGIGAIAIILSGEIIWTGLANLPIRPAFALDAMFKWVSGLAIVLLYSVLGCVYLKETEI